MAVHAQARQCRVLPMAAGLLLASAVLLGTVRPAAQGEKPQPSDYGRFRPIEADWNDPERLPPDKLGRAQFLESFERVVGVFKAAPGLHEPLGGADIAPELFSWGDEVSAEYPGGEDLPPGHPYFARLSMWIVPYVLQTGRPVAGRHWSYALHISANCLSVFAGDEVEYEEGVEAFYREPPPFEPTSTPGVYHFHGHLPGPHLLVTRRTAPLFVPVTNEQRLRRYLRAHEGYLQAHPQLQAEARLRRRSSIDAIKARLASLPPQVLAAHAVECDVKYWDMRFDEPTGREAHLCKPGARVEYKIVAKNPDFFARSLPKTSLQILALWGEGGDPPAGKITRRVVEAAWNTTDWKALLDVLR